MVFAFPDSCIVVFCKAPIAGQVKTRLTPALSPEEATEAHIVLTRRLLSLLSESKLCPIALWCSPDCEHTFFKDCVDHYGVSLHNQSEGNLGVKMQQAIEVTLQSFKHVLLVGCDCPSLSEADLREAICALKTSQDVVIAPAEDGGYVMIGCNASQPALFNNIAWGTKTVFGDTLKILKNLGLNYTTTTLKWDVDTFEDWQRFLSAE